MSVFTGLHVLCLFSAVLWFSCQLYKGHRWAELLINIAKEVRPCLTSISYYQSNIKAFARWAENTAFVKKVVFTYENTMNIRRNINWY